MRGLDCDLDTRKQIIKTYYLYVQSLNKTLNPTCVTPVLLSQQLEQINAQNFFQQWKSSAKETELTISNNNMLSMHGRTTYSFCNVQFLQCSPNFGSLIFVDQDNLKAGIAGIAMHYNDDSILI
jgi:hypothetical protein